MADTNVAATLTIWEHQPIWLIMAYFPNDLKNAKAMVKALGNIINTKDRIFTKNKRIAKPASKKYRKNTICTLERKLFVSSAHLLIGLSTSTHDPLSRLNQRGRSARD
jgi:hypothetical protein